MKHRSDYNNIFNIYMGCPVLINEKRSNNSQSQDESTSSEPKLPAEQPIAGLTIMPGDLLKLANGMIVKAYNVVPSSGPGDTVHVISKTLPLSEYPGGLKPLEAFQSLVNKHFIHDVATGSCEEVMDDKGKVLVSFKSDGWHSAHFKIVSKVTPSDKSSSEPKLPAEPLAGSFSDDKIGEDIIKYIKESPSFGNAVVFKRFMDFTKRYLLATGYETPWSKALFKPLYATIASGGPSEKDIKRAANTLKNLYIKTRELFDKEVTSQTPAQIGDGGADDEDKPSTLQDYGYLTDQVSFLKALSDAVYEYDNDTGSTAVPTPIFDALGGILENAISAYGLEPKAADPDDDDGEEDGSEQQTQNILPPESTTINGYYSSAFDDDNDELPNKFTFKKNKPVSYTFTLSKYGIPGVIDLGKLTPPDDWDLGDSNHLVFKLLAVPTSELKKPEVIDQIKYYFGDGVFGSMIALSNEYIDPFSKKPKSYCYVVAAHPYSESINISKIINLASFNSSSDNSETDEQESEPEEKSSTPPVEPETTEPEEEKEYIDDEPNIEIPPSSDDDVVTDNIHEYRNRILNMVVDRHKKIAYQPEFKKYIDYIENEHGADYWFDNYNVEDSEYAKDNDDFFDFEIALEEMADKIIEDYNKAKKQKADVKFDPGEVDLSDMPQSGYEKLPAGMSPAEYKHMTKIGEQFVGGPSLPLTSHEAFSDDILKMPVQELLLQLHGNAEGLYRKLISWIKDTYNEDDYSSCGCGSNIPGPMDMGDSMQGSSCSGPFPMADDGIGDGFNKRIVIVRTESTKRKKIDADLIVEASKALKIK